jgi:putative FmdB family regulatory protein
MPTYEYQCTNGHAFEVIQKISAKAKSKCPACGAKASRIISGGAGLIFKGTGFYITDYGKDGKGPRKESGADAPKPDAAAAPTSEPAPKTAPEAPSKPKKKAEKAAE